MKKQYPLLLAAGLMLLVHALFSTAPLTRLLQMPSGALAALGIGCPVSFSADMVHIHARPELTVSNACSGVRLFAILVGLGGGYWCGRHPRRWLALLPLAYGVTLFSNSVRIVMVWHFRRIFESVLPEWLHEFAHLGIGTVWSLTIITALLYAISRPPKPLKETNP
ncbi:exosortase/archaeosortase family protein [Pontiella sp.]|uniref:exosortase/archaeosortase family protein n=1 Tax=Pontiella sp. TaxID=2837462 RepID=UPI00356260E8